MQPALPQFYQPAPSISNGHRARICGVGGGGNVRPQSIWKGKGLESRGRRVPRTIFQTGSEAKRPRLVKPAVQNAEHGVVFPRDDNQLMIRTDARVQPYEQPMLGDGGRRDIPGQAVDCLPHLRSRTLVPPPEIPESLDPVLLTRRLNLFGDMGKRGQSIPIRK